MACSSMSGTENGYGANEFVPKGEEIYIVHKCMFVVLFEASECSFCQNRICQNHSATP